MTGKLPDRDQSNEQPQTPRSINPLVPVELEAICLKAMADDPTARYAGSAELADDLRISGHQKARITAANGRLVEVQFHVDLIFLHALGDRNFDLPNAAPGHRDSSRRVGSRQCLAMRFISRIRTAGSRALRALPGRT